MKAVLALRKHVMEEWGWCGHCICLNDGEISGVGFGCMAPSRSPHMSFLRGSDLSDFHVEQFGAHAGHCWPQNWFAWVPTEPAVLR